MITLPKGSVNSFEIYEIGHHAVEQCVVDRQIMFIMYLIYFFQTKIHLIKDENAFMSIKSKH